MSKETIKLDMDAYDIPKAWSKSLRSVSEQKEQADKIARLYALAEKLHVKIGGAIDGRA